MATQHKRPLYAFVVLSLLAALALVGAARSDAVGGRLRDHAVVVAGRVLEATQPTGAPAAPRDGLVAVVTWETVPDVAGTLARAHRDRSRTVREGAAASAPTSVHAADGRPRGRAVGRARHHDSPPAHARAHGHGRSPGHAKAHRGAHHAKGYGKTPHAKPHGRGHGKR